MVDRPTSVSKNVKGLHDDEKALDRANRLKDKFPEPAKEQDDRLGVVPGKGSGMVRDDAPGMAPVPPGRIRRGPDRSAAIDKLEQERREAAARNEAAKAWAKFQGREEVKAQENERGKQYGNPEPEKQEPEKAPQDSPDKAWEKFQERQKEIGDREKDQGRER